MLMPSDCATVLQKLLFDLFDIWLSNMFPTCNQHKQLAGNLSIGLGRPRTICIIYVIVNPQNLELLVFHIPPISPQEKHRKAHSSQSWLSLALFQKYSYHCSGTNNADAVFFRRGTHRGWYIIQKKKLIILSTNITSMKMPLNNAKSQPRCLFD